jgi:hypothetical protein
MRFVQRTLVSTSVVKRVIVRYNALVCCIGNVYVVLVVVTDLVSIVVQPESAQIDR